ncbi:MAG: hypothetical protein GX798_01120 [Bacteroidales bacterium]|nr:hypothetical protein [Bacteroidales bacterium]
MKRLLTFLLLIIPMTSMINAQSYKSVDYSDLWAKVEKALKKGLPQTAVKYLDELEDLATKADDGLELLVVCETKLDQLREYNWKEASPYYSKVDLIRSIVLGDLNGSIAKYSDHPRVLRLHYHKLLEEKRNIDYRFDKSGADYLAFKSRCLDLLKGHSSKDYYYDNVKEIVESMDSEDLSGSISGYRNQYVPHQDVAIRISTRNLSRVTLDIYRLNDNRFWKEGYRFGLFDLKRISTKVSSHTYDMPDEYNIPGEKRDTISCGQAGNYVLHFHSGKHDSYTDICVSSVATGLRKVGNVQEIYAANIVTGKPYKEVLAEAYRNPGRKYSGSIVKITPAKKAIVTQKGFTELPMEFEQKKGKEYIDWALRVSAGKDIYAPLLSVDNYRVETELDRERMSEGMSLYTDRKLYKPSDTIFFKVICYKSDRERGEVLANKPIELSIRHTSEDKPFATFKVVTNDMGSASGFFTLPEESKNGKYYIMSEYRHLGEVRVETYKRPNFDFKLEPNEGVYIFSDIVRQKGTVESFAGYSIAGCKVEYSVTCHSVWHPGHRSYNSYYSEEVTSGEVLSDNDGHFEISFIAKHPAGDSFNPKEHSEDVIAFVIDTKVTDPQGETHSKSTTVRVSDIPLVMGLRFSTPMSQSYKDPDNNVSRVIVEKNEVKAVTFTVDNLNYRPYETKVTYSLLQDGKVVGSETVSSNSEIPFDFASVKSGAYTLAYKSVYRGIEIEGKTEIVIFDTNENRLPVKAVYFYYPIVTENGIEFLIGTTEDNLWLEMGLFDNHKCHHRESLHLKNEVLRISLPYKEEYRSSVKMSIFGFRNGEAIDHQYEFSRPDKVLFNVGIESFRDCTGPQSKEKFTIIGAPDAEYVVSIFDKTTDRYGANSFSFNPLDVKVYNSAPYIRTTLGDSYRTYYGFRLFEKRKALSKSSSVSGANAALESIPLVMDLMDVEEERSIDTEAGDGQEAEETTVRSQFGELIAFYPHLRSDRDGKVEVEYTTGDLLSTFRVLVMGYDKSLKTGNAERSLIVRKELMVVPNIPLFIREGDKIVIKSKVVNLSDEQLQGNGYIEFYNEETGEKLTLKDTESKVLTLAVGAQKELAWSITPPENVSKLGVVIRFKAGNFSDGEKHIVTILPKEITITEAASFVIGGPHGHKYYEDQLHQRIKARNPRIRHAEYSTLTAVKESLPVVSKPESNNAIDWTLALYINQMRAKVLTLDQKEVDSASTESFRNEAITALSKLNNSDGGFAWFDGMPSSERLTLFFLEKMCQLRNFGALEFSESEKKLVEGAVSYIDEKIREAYNREGYNPFNYIELFYVRSHYLEYQMKGKVSTAFDKFLSNTADGWQKIAILNKARLAHILLNSKETNYWNKKFESRIEDLKTSLKDYAVVNPTIGCYFPNAVMPFRGLMNSEIYAHAKLMTLFARLGEKDMVDSLALWMLLQKHNQAWENTVATTDAVHALIASGAKDLKLGAVYYTYDTVIDDVKPAANEIEVNREFVRASDSKVIMDGDKLNIGDEIIARYFIKNSENRSFVRMKAMRPACFYPLDERSFFFTGFWGEFYKEQHESLTNYYFELLPEGNLTIEERFYITQEGTFSTSLVEIESLYANEYRGHTGSMKITSK